MKRLLAIIALLSIVSLADARLGVGGGIGVGRPGVGVAGRPVARAAVREAAYEESEPTIAPAVGLGVTGAAIASHYGERSEDGRYSRSYTTRPVARGAVVRGVR